MERELPIDVKASEEISRLKYDYGYHLSEKAEEIAVQRGSDIIEISDVLTVAKISYIPKVKE